MEIILKISTNKRLVTFIYFLSLVLHSQDNSKSDFYREDQFYFGSSYFIQTESIENFKQNGFSGNFQLGFIRDIPINSSSTNALGIGIGFERNYFTSNIQPTEKDNKLNYEIIVSRFLESKNKISFSSILIPIEYRWRKSTLTEYKFWRVYSGFKIKKNFPVFAGNSFVGQTQKTYMNFIEVILLSDTEHVLPIKSGFLFCNARGKGKPMLISCNINDKDFENQIGDIVLTSNLSIYFPPNLPVGEVVSIFEKSDSSNRIVTMKLFSDLSTINQLFVLLNEDMK